MNEKYHPVRIAVTIICVLGAIVVCTGVSPASAQSIQELYKAAKAEGSLVIYGGGPAALYEP